MQVTSLLLESWAPPTDGSEAWFGPVDALQEEKMRAPYEWSGSLKTAIFAAAAALVALLYLTVCIGLTRLSFLLLQ